MCAALVFSLIAAVAHAQDYTSIVVFGDSLSDTGNAAHLTQTKYGIRIPGVAADYTDGRFTNGSDTIPPSFNYKGVWVEQLAAMLPAKPAVVNSLDGGTNYAYGLATTGTGTTAFTFGPGDAFSVNVNNVSRQITTYLATKPKINEKTLFVVWAGANDLLGATSSRDVADAAIRQAANVERLVEAGATQILVPNLPPLGLIPRLNGSPVTAIPATQATVVYNSVLRLGLTIVQAANLRKRVRVFQMNVFNLFQSAVASPSSYLLADVTRMAQGNYAANPDTYLFWDDLHPTTRGHEILATSAFKMLQLSACSFGGFGINEVGCVASR
ncbi:hypothetical protein BH10ACI4_BH10ACI4_06840 [soil metagenome]